MSTQSQKGFAHAVLIIGLVVALIGALSFVFWQNFIYKEPVAQSPVVVTQKMGDEKKDATATKNPYEDWNTYVTKEEGFSISYPDTWEYKNTKTGYSFDSFTLTGPKGFVIRCNIATIPLDGPGSEGKVVFVDEIKNANYGEPLYVVGHYNDTYSNLDRVMVTSSKYEAGFSGYGGPRGFFASKIPETGDKGQQGANFVFLQGEFPLYKDAEGNERSPAHVDFNTNSDLKEARKILGSLTYK